MKKNKPSAKKVGGFRFVGVEVFDNTPIFFLIIVPVTVRNFVVSNLTVENVTATML